MPCSRGLGLAWLARALSLGTTLALHSPLGLRYDPGRDADSRDEYVTENLGPPPFLGRPYLGPQTFLGQREGVVEPLCDRCIEPSTLNSGGTPA